MKIEPLCPELIAKLEIAIAHRNRERAVAVVERYFKELDDPALAAIDTPLANILPMRQASLLARAGYITVKDLAGVREEEIAAIKGVGSQFICKLKQQLSKSIKF
jgi:hypothetical protein